MSLTKEYIKLLKELGPKKIIELLSPYTTKQRLERFKTVISQRIPQLVVVIERVYDPHNAAAVIRTAEAMGLSDVYLIEIEGNKLSRKVTIGSETWLNVHWFNSSKTVHNLLKEKGFLQIGGIPPYPDTNSPLKKLSNYPKSIPFREIKPQWPIAIWMGNEREGLSLQTVQKLDKVFHIPMYGFTQSLNLSVSTAIVLEHLSWLYRQTNGPILTQQEQIQKLAEFLFMDLRDSLTLLKRLLRSKNQ